MTICEKCKDKPCTKTGKPCREVEKLLNAKEVGGYSERHLQRKQVVYDPHKIEVLASEVAFKRKYGRKYNLDKGEMS